MQRPKGMFAFPKKALTRSPSLSIDDEEIAIEAILEQGLDEKRNSAIQTPEETLESLPTEARLANIRMRPARFRVQDETALHNTLVDFFRFTGKQPEQADISFAPP